MQRKTKILFIEDNEQYGNLIVQYLREKKEYHVDWIKTFVEIDFFVKDALDYDLIITDIQLPGITGDVITMILNDTNSLQDIPVLISSGLYDESYLEDKNIMKALDKALYVDFCEKGKTKWLMFKIDQLLKIRKIAVSNLTIDKK